MTAGTGWSAVKRRAALCLLALFLTFCAVWIASLLRCEWLTARYKEEFSPLYAQTGMLGAADSVKVLRYEETRAEVYYVSRGRAGSVVTFARREDLWTMERWRAVWSTSGSADGFVWPYVR